MVLPKHGIPADPAPRQQRRRREAPAASRSALPAAGRRFTLPPMASRWDSTLRALTRHLEAAGLPSVTAIALERRNPFDVLVSTVISLRTRDEVTAAASRRLLARAPDPAALARLPQRSIETLIYPAGFYRTKARHLRAIAGILIAAHGAEVPQEMEALLALPGVGRKTANLVRNLGFGLDGICVDTHVHRISNRLGWVRTKNPAETEKALEKVLPRKHWIAINTILVQFGQITCKPLSPICSACPLARGCPRIGVTRAR
jgi:endonuclease-3